MTAKTLLELAGVTPIVPRLAEATLLIIDAQNEYVDGALPLAGVEDALGEIAHLLARARERGASVVHIKHRGRAGGAFDPGARRGEIVPQAAPRGDEPIVEKTLPNAFAGTDLKSVLEAKGRRDLVIVGFMTHMCIEATARAALDLGFRPAVVAAATATRDLPDPLGGPVIPAAEVQRNALAALNDRFATVVKRAEDLPL
ncbi:MAG TPA: cysteine hydrolase family protein [Xanthobacteraceae bacterium]|nr:cysteine hydrolase family protein [Xanthobacteraceae bacterium]